jgi:lipopolysaccharide export system protein LptA
MAAFINSGKNSGVISIFALSAAVCALLTAGLWLGGFAVSDSCAAEQAKAEAAQGPSATVKPETGKAPVKAKENKSARNSLLGGGDKEPTVITASSLTADNKAKTALFSGSVVAKKGETTLYADRMLVYYTETGDGENSSVDRIECSGHVRLVRNTRIITAGKAVYYAGEPERAVFTEKPRATENKNVITGSVMTYYIKEDRSVVDNSKIFIVDKEGGSLDRKPAKAGKK